MDIQQSPLIESANIKESPTKEIAIKNPAYTFILAIIICALVIYLAYYAYNCFKSNQDAENKPDKSEKSDKPDKDCDDGDTFNVEDEIQNLRNTQEKNLKLLNKC